MAGPWIRTVPASYGVAGKTDDQLIDMLCRMGKAPRVNPPSVIRAAYAEAQRRGIVTANEAAVGIALCVKIKPLKDEAKTASFWERPLNPEFLGAARPRAGEDY